MPKPRTIEAKLYRLRDLRREPPAPEHRDELQRALADSSSLVVAAAAEIAGERALADLAPDMVAAFDRFMIDPAETDKMCRAKQALVEALNKIEYDREDIFLKGIRHVQKEARFGKPDDTAAALRGHSAFGLVRINYHDVLLVLVDLLVDEEKTARAAAARALGETGAPAAVPLLRFKALTGDKEPEVIAECLAALMSAEPKQSLAFVARFLRSADEAVQEGAAYALGESRRPEALALLTDHWPKARGGELQEVILLAISMTRLPAALDFLVGVLAGEDRGNAAAALSALAVHRHNEGLRARVAAEVTKKNDAKLNAGFTAKFGRD